MEIKNDLAKMGLALGAIVLLLGMMFFLKIGKPGGGGTPINNQIGFGKKETFPIELRIDYGGTPSTALTLLQAKTGDTALSVLEGSHKIETQDSPAGKTVVSVDGIDGKTGTKSWNYYINGATGKVSPEKAEIKKGDQVEWRLEVRTK